MGVFLWLPLNVSSNYSHTKDFHVVIHKIYINGISPAAVGIFSNYWDAGRQAEKKESILIMLTLCEICVLLHSYVLRGTAD